MRLLVATDLDGTLTFDGRRPHRSVLEAIERIATLPEVRVAVATARSPRVVGEWFGALDPHLDRVCCNGALVQTATAELGRSVLCPRAVQRVTAYLDAHREPYCLEYGDHFVASAPDALPWMGDRARAVAARARPAPGVLKVAVANGAGQVDRLRALVGGAGVVLPHLTGDADVVPRGADKADGVRRLVAGLGFRPTVLALGNDLNDQRLLREADRSIVVGDGLPELDRHSHVRRVAASPRAVAAALHGASRTLLPG